MTDLLEQPVADDVIALPRAAVAPRERRRYPWKRWMRRAAIATMTAVVLLWVFQRLVGPLMFEHRQAHLAESFATPKPTVTRGDAVAVLQIPAIGLNRIVVEGASVDHLRSGPSRVSDSALPGDAGVMVIYGHRSTYGAPFGRNAALTKGAEIVVQARNGPIVQYVVDRVERNTRVASIDLGADPGSLAYLLLVSGEGRWVDGDQMVVVARALPVTDAAPVAPDLGAGVQRSLPISLSTLLAFASLGTAMLAASWLRRWGAAVVVVAVLPAIALASLWLLISAESLLPVAR